MRDSDSQYSRRSVIPAHCWQTSDGFSLIELVITLMVLTILMLGVSPLTQVAIRTPARIKIPALMKII